MPECCDDCSCCRYLRAAAQTIGAAHSAVRANNRSAILTGRVAYIGTRGLFALASAETTGADSGVGSVLGTVTLLRSRGPILSGCDGRPVPFGDKPPGS